MDANALGFAIATALAALPVLWMADRFLTKRAAARLVARVIASVNTSDCRPKPKPESDCVVEVSDYGATCSRPDGKIESIEWNDLKQVAILTTDDGPFAPDMFWLLYGSKDGCVIPWGATGERQLVDRLQALPGFRNEVIVNASSLTANGFLMCWGRTD